MLARKTVEGADIQRRSFFRLACQIPVQYRWLKKSELYRMDDGEWHAGTICNLSGGGVLMQSPIEMDEQDRVFITLRLAGEDLLLMGEIRIRRTGPYGEKQYGIMFTGISMIDQDKIVRYLFQQQPRRVRVRA